MKNIHMQSCAILDHKIWFVTVDDRFIWMDLNTGETHYVMPKGNKIFKNVIHPMHVFGRQIYWVEQDGKRLLSYDLDSEICKTYELNNINERDYVAFSLITKWEDTIILVPKCTDKILIFDTRKESFIEKDGIFKEYFTVDDRYVEHAFAIDEYIYIFFSESCTALRYSMGTGETCVIDRKSLDRRILSSCWCGDVLYVLDSEGNILAVDRKFELIRTYTNTENRLEGYYSLFVWDNHLIVLPSTENEIISINLENAGRESMMTPSDLVYEDINWSKYIGYTESKEMILVPNRMSNYIFVLNRNDLDIRWIKPVPPDHKEEAQHMVYTGTDTFEDDNLELFIEYVCLKTDQSMENEKGINGR